MNLKEIKELFRSEKSIKIVLISGVVIILVIAFSGLYANDDNVNEKEFFNYYRQSEYEEALENKLCAILSEINGIGDVKIMITLDTSEENRFDDDDELICVRSPSVRGVIVVCDGGDNILVREKVINAVSGAFGISTTRVNVIK